MFAFGEGQSKRVFAGIVFGIGMAVGAVNFMHGSFRRSRAMRTNRVYEEFLAAQAKVNSTVAPGSTETSSQPNTVPENAPVTTADQTSSWWAAQREAQKTPATADTNDQQPR
jgi:hypothetical protein